MNIHFKTKNEKQLEAARAWVNDDVDEILYGGAKGGGKSFLGASLIFGDALIYPETQFFIARHELNDLRKFTIPTIHEVFKNFKIDFKQYASYNGQDNVFALKNGSKVFLIACKDEPSDPLFERFGSMQMTRGWIEEAGEVAEAAKANLALAIGRWKNDDYKLKRKLFLTANPKKGWMKRDFVDPSTQGLLAPARRYIQAFATDNPYLPADYVEALRNEKDNVRRQRLWEGNWDYNEDFDALVSYDALTDAFTNTVVKDGQTYLIVDVARGGRDATVFSLWHGLEEVSIEKYQKQTTDITAQKIRDVAAIEKVPFSNILVDEDGIGGGVVDNLKGVKGFTANSVPLPTAAQIRERQAKVDHFLVPKTTFGNLKAQCGWKLAELINERKIAFKVPDYRDEILEDLTSILKDGEPDGDGRKRLRAKEDAKKELGHSPDVGDTHLMRAWFELKKDAFGEADIMAKKIAEQQQARMDRKEQRKAGESTR